MFKCAIIYITTERRKNNAGLTEKSSDHRK